MTCTPLISILFAHVLTQGPLVKLASPTIASWQETQVRQHQWIYPQMNMQRCFRKRLRLQRFSQWQWHQHWCLELLGRAPIFWRPVRFPRAGMTENCLNSKEKALWYFMCKPSCLWSSCLSFSLSPSLSSSLLLLTFQTITKLWMKKSSCKVLAKWK